MAFDSRDIIDAVAERSAMRLAPGRCIRLRGQAPCESCASACALRLPFATPAEILSLDHLERCTRCGACAAACPTGAIEVPEPLLAGWLRRLRVASLALSDGEPLSISCGSAPTAGHVTVPCIRGIDGSLVLRALALGAPQIVLILGDCRSCESGDATTDAGFDEFASNTTSFAAALGLGPVRIAHHGDAWSARPEGQTGVDRREFFASLRDEGRSLIGAVVREALPMQDSKSVDEIDAGRPAPRRHIAVDAVEHASTLAGLDPRSTTPLPAQGPGALSHRVPRIHDSSCTGCGECAVFCPTGALRVRVVDTEWRLSVSSRLCVGCGLCEQLCRSSSIALEEMGISGVIRPKRVILHRGRARVCARCSKVFAMTEDRSSEDSPALRDVCPACASHDGRFADLY